MRALVTAKNSLKLVNTKLVNLLSPKALVGWQGNAGDKFTALCGGERVRLNHWLSAATPSRRPFPRS
jgi:hypothetical protein